MIKKNKICIIVILIIGLFSIVLINENTGFINLIDDKFQIKSLYDFEDSICVNNISYKIGKKQTMAGIEKIVVSAFNITNNKILWEYYNETYNYGHLRKIEYYNNNVYAVGSEYNSQYGIEKLMVLSINATNGALNWKYYNDSFKFSRLNTVAIYQDIIYCAGYESNKALIISLNLNGTLRGKYLINNYDISEIKSIDFKNNSVYCVAKSWNNKNSTLVLPINQLNF